MNAHERVNAVFNHQKPDHIPVLFRAMDNQIQYEYLDEYGVDEADECFYWRDVTPLLAMQVDAFDFGFRYRNNNPDIQMEEKYQLGPFGRIRKKGAYADGYIKNREIWNLWNPPTLMDEKDPENFRKMTELVGDRLVCFANLTGIFEYVWECMGLSTFARAQRKDPKFIESIIESNEKLTTEMLKRLVDEGVQYFSICDDLGFKNGLITNLPFYETYIFPRYQKFCELVHKHGGKIYLHAEGNITEAIPGLIQAGFDAVQGLTLDDGINLADIKTRFGDKIALFGTISHALLYSSSSKVDIKSMVDQSFKDAGTNGGLMIGPSAAADKGTNVENLKYFIEYVHSLKY